MKIKIILFALFLTNFAYSQKLSVLNQSAFNVGETLKYKFRYGFFTGAEATLQVLNSNIKFDNHETLRLVAQGRTSGTFDIFYKVRNQYESYIDKDTFVPYFYIEDINESDYHRNDKVRFYPTEKKIVAKKGTFKSTANQIFDLVSAYYFTRNVDLSSLNIGQQITLNYFLEDSITELPIQYIGREKVKTNMGWLFCKKYSPAIQPGRIFRSGSHLYIWITDDDNHIPVKAQAELVVGSVTMELTKSLGLKTPLTFVSKY
jgi:hypothetical protein